MRWRTWASPVVVDPGSPGCGWAIRHLSRYLPLNAALLRSAVPSKAWHAKVDGDGVASTPVELGELVVGAGEADLEAFDLGDAGEQVVADLLQAGALRWVWSQERTPDASVFMNAGRSEGTRAGPDGHLPFLEVGEKCIPLFVGGGAVFFAGTGRPTPGEERQVGLDRLVGVDRLVAHGDVDVSMASDHLGDVGRQPAHDRVGDEHPPEIVRGKVQGAAGRRVDQTSAGQRGSEHVADDVGADPTVLGAKLALEQQRRRWQPHAFVPVVGGNQGNRSGVVADSADDRAEHLSQFGSSLNRVGSGGLEPVG